MTAHPQITYVVKKDHGSIATLVDGFAQQCTHKHVATPRLLNDRTAKVIILRTKSLNTMLKRAITKWRTILDDHPERHLVMSEKAGPLLENLHAELSQWGCEPGPSSELGSIARHIEPDLIVMDQASQKLTAAAVCFPSSWNPADWPDAGIQEIHAVVPQLNASIGQMIEKFLRELKPGKAFQRANWSFTRTAELNYHPALQRQTLDETIQLDEIHLRIEHQLFTAIEGAVVMGIRIQPIPLLSLREDEALWQNLFRVIETMPEDVARYKSLHLGKETLANLVSGA